MVKYKKIILYKYDFILKFPKYLKMETFKFGWSHSIHIN